MIRVDDRARKARYSPTQITLAWLVRLRWGATLGQALTIGTSVLGLGLKLPMLPLGTLVFLTFASNVALFVWMRKAVEVSTRTMGTILASDTLVLSALLYFSGGPSNPFSVLYLVHVTLAALVLGMRWAGAIVAVSAASYAGLFFWHVPIVGMEHAHHGGPGYSIHLQGMWIAFTIAATLIAYFVSRVAAALRQREVDLADARAAAAKAERLASLTTLAAGAAHELGTPLATIAVAAKELERSVTQEPEAATLDARLIRTEVDRCREIVQRMSADAGHTMGELPEHTSATHVFGRCVARLDVPGALRVKVDAPEIGFAAPVDGLVQVLYSLLQNALHAGEGQVVLSAQPTSSAVRLVVEDHGAGIPVELLPRVGEPFFTTRAPGEGMGLGVFLARTFAERCGGRLELYSRPGEGTRVTIELPRAELTQGSPS